MFVKGDESLTHSLGMIAADVTFWIRRNLQRKHLRRHKALQSGLPRRRLRPWPRDGGHLQLCSCKKVFVTRSRKQALQCIAVLADPAAAVAKVRLAPSQTEPCNKAATAIQPLRSRLSTPRGRSIESIGSGSLRRQDHCWRYSRPSECNPTLVAARDPGVSVERVPTSRSRLQPPCAVLLGAAARIARTKQRAWSRYSVPDQAEVWMLAQECGYASLGWLWPLQVQRAQRSWATERTALQPT